MLKKQKSKAERVHSIRLQSDKVSFGRTRCGKVLTSQVRTSVRGEEVTCGKCRAYLGLPALAEGEATRG